MSAECGSCGGQLGRYQVGLCALCRTVENTVSETERAARLCEARAQSLADSGNIVAANEAMKCAAAIRAPKAA